MPTDKWYADKNFLIYCFFVEFVLVAGFFLNKGWTPRLMSVHSAAYQQSYHSYLDPPLRHSAPTLLVLDRSNKVIDLTHTRQAMLIVFFSNCKVCSLQYMRKLQAFQDEHPEMLIKAVAPENSVDISRFLSSNHLGLDFYSEYTSDTTSKYNTAWYPRVFLLDSSGRIKYEQGADTSFEEALQQSSELRLPERGK